MKRILFIVTKGQTGGAQKFVYEQINILSGSFECYLATNHSGWLSDNLYPITKSILLNKSIEGLSITYLFRLRNFIVDNKIDLVVCNSANAGLYGRVAAYFSKAKTIYVSHGWSAIYNGGKLSFLYKLIENILVHITTSILCVSKNDYELAIHKLKISENKLRCISNAIIPFDDKVSVQLNADSQKYKLLTIARLAHPKRIDLLIKAVSVFKNIQLTIVGGGPEMEKLKSIVEVDKTENVYFLGEVKGFKNFDEHDIFALISESEGLPMSAIEAMSFGMPLILSDVGGCSELINNSGVLVNNDVADIQRGILDCITNMQLFAQNSMLHYERSFNLLNNKNVYIDYYKTVISV